MAWKESGSLPQPRPPSHEPGAHRARRAPLDVAKERCMATRKHRTLGYVAAAAIFGAGFVAGCGQHEPPAVQPETPAIGTASDQTAADAAPVDLRLHQS